MYKKLILEKIDSVNDLRKLKLPQLLELSSEIREYIIDVVSQNGGHLASSLGVVELTLALHYVFDTPKDKIIWDVGHQSYAHKILTGRRESFPTLRQGHGISGFPKTSESEFDSFNTGHSSTSLSLALGEAVARDLKRQKHKVIAVIGDGSMTAGMSFEALNHIGHMKKDVIIILNDNEHSISKNVGALSESFMKMITGSIYNTLKRRSYEFINKIPRYGKRLYEFIYKKEARLKGFFIPGAFFEELGIRYFGPVDGHNLKLMLELFERIRKLNNGPRIIHLITRKGKGYVPAEKNPDLFHGVGSFDKESGNIHKTDKLSYSKVAGKTLVEIAKYDKSVIAVTAAMKLGTGLAEFEKKAPSRFFDVGIAEQHAVTFAAGMAARGFKPFVSIYSTFLQRAVDQLIHDVALSGYPVKILIDRAGVVGEDGETHQGLFDISLISNIPYFVFLSPANGLELRDSIYFAANYNKGPVAIRYPRGTCPEKMIHFSEHNKIIPGKLKKIRKGEDIALFAIGDMVIVAVETAKKLKKSGINASVFNILSLKPLDIMGIEKVIEGVRFYITLENTYLSGGIGEKINSGINRNLRHKGLFISAFPDEFITHNDIKETMNSYNMDPESIASRVITMIKVKNINEKRNSIRRISC